MTAEEIRRQFIEFFENKNHTQVRSAPVVPQDDPTLLFTNAGMNQFKDIFLGKGKRPYTRAVNSQKCIRVSGKHNDLEEVGRDTYHHTFFEMLGNWSFGDYYKKEAITWAWELFTDVWKLPKEKLYATVYTTDDEAYALWKSETDIASDHILRYAEKDNFWEMGATGPCGPCSEIHIDLGADFCDKQGEEHVCGVNGDCGRYIELWNLVFIQYNRDEEGELHALPQTHVDTGAGFERIVAVLQNKKSNYDTDVFMPLIHFIGEIAGQDYATSSEQVAFRVIADHVRMLTFSITDGGLPSNEGRGYVMRRILRRAARYGRKLGMQKPFIYKLVPKVVELMGAAYPELNERADHVIAVIRKEEEHFNRTLDRGLEIFDSIKKDLQKNKQTLIPGEHVFKLYDTYGFPVDLTRVLAEENGLTLDMDGFEKEMEVQRERARAHSNFAVKTADGAEWIILNKQDATEFTGYSHLTQKTRMARYQISEDAINVVLTETPFYAESGGQVGDQGTISGDDFSLKVIDTQKDGDTFIHICEPQKGFEPKSDLVEAKVNISLRRETVKNHTATHLLHAALHTVIGSHVHQAGSLVEPGRLRFDFNHSEKIAEEDLLAIERLVNEQIQLNNPLEIKQEKFTEAQKNGAMALFGEKYGDIVRTVKIADFSHELCGGTHVNSTGEIGLFIIMSESGIASGVRRIEAITGQTAVTYMQELRNTRQQLGRLLNSPENEINNKISQLLSDKKTLEKEIQKLQAIQMQAGAADIIAGAETIGTVKVIIKEFSGSSVDQLKDLADEIRQKSENTLGLLCTENEGKLGFVCFAADNLVKSKRFNAGNLVREVARTAGGGGGGRPHLATAGGKDLSKKKAALEQFRKSITAEFA